MTIILCTKFIASSLFFCTWVYVSSVPSCAFSYALSTSTYIHRQINTHRTRTRSAAVTSWLLRRSGWGGWGEKKSKSMKWGGEKNSKFRKWEPFKGAMAEVAKKKQRPKRLCHGSDKKSLEGAKYLGFRGAPQIWEKQGNLMPKIPATCFITVMILHLRGMPLL